MVEYYYEYWEGDDVYSGTVEAQNEHIAYKQIQQIIRNDIATIHGGDVIGCWLFTRADSDQINTTSLEPQFTEEDMESYRSRCNNEETITIERKTHYTSSKIN